MKNWNAGKRKEFEDRKSLEVTDMRDRTMKMIVAAAIKSAHDGQTYSIPKPGRHMEIRKRLRDSGHPWPVIGEEGFLTARGLFLDRKRAMKIARINGQLLPGRGESAFLTSEDLW